MTNDEEYVFGKNDIGRKWYVKYVFIFLVLVISFTVFAFFQNKNYPYRRFKYLTGLDIPSNVICIEYKTYDVGFPLNDGWEKIGLRGDKENIRKWMKKVEISHSVKWLKGNIRVGGFERTITNLPQSMNGLTSFKHCFVKVLPPEIEHYILILVDEDYQTVWVYAEWN